MSQAAVLTERFDRALLYATHVHGGQVRKKTSIPYIAHLLAVAATVLEYGGDEDLAIAGLLHDAAEDQGWRPAARRHPQSFRRPRGRGRRGLLRQVGGPRSKKGGLEDPQGALHPPPWDRGQGILLVSLSDKVHNARSILRDLRKPEPGSRVWDRFSQPKETTLWYYCELAEAFESRRRDQLSNELAEIVSVLEQES